MADVETHPNNSNAAISPRFIVGIGSSAGGLEALRSLFSALEGKPPMAFVVVQHLAPQHKSRLVEILAQSTPLRVKEVEDGIIPEVQTIYITPPNSDVYFANGALRLVEPHLKIGPKPSVDYFFRSLADDFGARAIAIVLSGTGSDGAHGIRAVKAAGGFTMSQTPTSAKYDGMPKAAKHTGAVDVELSPEEIARELSRFGTLSLDNIRNALAPDTQFDRIFRLLEQNKGVSFSDYKPSTIRRRVERRIIATRCESLEEYTNFLRDNPRESNELFQDILISVTAFFRDPEAFDALERHIEKRLASKSSGDTFRCWIIGCATGEEPYSIAILVAEAIERLGKNVTLQVFATDLDEVALNVARRGCYSRGTFDKFPNRLQEKYFIPCDDQLQIRPSLRDTVIFARHNAIEDPPFLNTDLVSCRNVLIYFNHTLQERVFRTVCYSLNKDGILFLGRSESVSSSVADLFDVQDKESRIYYSVKGKSRLAPPSTRGGRAENAELLAAQREPRPDAVGSEVFQSMIEGFAPDSLIIDEERRVKHTFGRANEFLSFPKGEATYDLAKLLPAALGAELPTLLYRVNATGRFVKGKKHSLEQGEEAGRLQLVVVPLRAQLGPKQYLVAFRSSAAVAETTMGDAADPALPANEQVKELCRELNATREQLQSVMEEYQASNEELQSLNEEMQSANEELQSSNEELETTNEELQSTNEELTTLNQELNVKSSELQMLYLRHQAIQHAIPYPLLVIDSRLNVLDFNPPARHLLRIGDADVGSQIQTVPTNIDLTEVKAEIADALEHQKDKRFQFATKDRCFEVQIQVFYGDRNSIDGAVVSFMDNTEITMALEESKVMKARLSSIIDNTPAMVTIKDLSGVYVFANNRFCEVTQIEEEDVLGCTDDELFGKDVGRKIRERDFEVLKSQEPLQFEEAHEIEGTTRYWTSSKFVLLDAKKRPYSVCTISLDITDRASREHQLELFRRAVTSANSGTVILEDRGQGLTVTYCSDHFSSLLGYSYAALTGISLRELFRKIRMQGGAQSVEEAAAPLESGAGSTFTFVSLGEDGAELTFEMRSARLSHHGEGVPHLILSIFDVTERLKDQRLILSQQEELSRYARYSALGEIAAGISHEINTPLNVITANTDILKAAVQIGRLTDERVVESADDIEKMAKGISGIVQGLKSVAGIDPGSFERASMQKLLRDAIKICEFRLQRSAVDLKLHVPEADLIVCCYPIQVMQIIINLVNNALEAIAGSKAPWVSIALADRGDKVLLTVKDSGTGIDPAIAEKIMTPFFSTKKESNGTGIGLSLSRSIARRHSGDLYLDSSAANTTFCLEIAKEQP